MRFLLLVCMILPGLLFGQANANYDPDHDLNGCYTMLDILSLLVIMLPDNAGFDTPNANYDPDFDGDGQIGIDDLIGLLTVFGTCIEEAQPCEPISMDGHTYAVVPIGDQCWFAENLRTTSYRNGDTLETDLSDMAWSNATSGSTSTYGAGSSACLDDAPGLDACDDTLSLEATGRLYNWYAVNDERGLCPAGWHVPSHEEWQELECYLTTQVPTGTEGNAIKTSSGWYNGGNGTDQFGFSGKPAGRRNTNGDFGFAGKYSYWWSSTSEGEGAWFRFLYYINSDVQSASGDADFGFSVRCLQNVP